ncbi:MAG: DUF664 domain-containing protein [Ignavibacteria bacterium]|nr:DUF664 domain-containing protein [Ignavibacteria bacterium]
MKNENIYLIDDIAGYTPLISSLVSMMNYIRKGTISSISGLTTEQLDNLFDKKSNSIGMLLKHMAMVEKAYQLITFSGLNEKEDEQFSALHPGLDLDERRFEIKNNPAQYYTDLLNETRAHTLNEFKNRDDLWLKQTGLIWGSRKANNWFKWFHVVEEEIYHSGQINLMKKRLSSLTNNTSKIPGNNDK